MPEGARPDKAVIAVVGPTASGKTRLAESLATHYGGEIVTADSMQVYRGMDIGTAKIPIGERHVRRLENPHFPVAVHELHPA